MMQLRRRFLVSLGAVALALPTAVALQPSHALPPDGVDLEVYVGILDADGVEKMRDLGLDASDIAGGMQATGEGLVEAVLSSGQAAKLRDAGVDLRIKKVNGVAASESLRRKAVQGWDVFRPYGGPGGLRAELMATAREHRSIAKIVRLGETVQGQQILAVKVTKNATKIQDGRRPAVLYLSAQHAREWITPEMTRRLMHHVLDGYGNDPRITRLVDTTELWFVPVANPDGYDFTFTEGNRLWRKNLRDNNGDAEITVGDGVDLNRNFSVRWGYDNEGSSPDPASDTYRGPSAQSEPETQALDRLMRRVRFDFLVNYHSAAELLLYGVGWQVSTPSPDDVIHEAMAGTDANPAVPGYDPDLSAELYTTNGETDTHAAARYATVGFTPEMSTCQAVSDSVPDDQWLAADCASVFNFPDDEDLVQAEFEKNLPFALSAATSARDPDDPVSAIGLDAADLVPDPFDVSYGRAQPVAVIAKRSLRDVRLRYSINGGRTRSTAVRQWRGGQRYGDMFDEHYGEFRGVVRAAPGDSVQVWFTGRNRGRAGNLVETEPFTYTVHDEIGADVLILANEDVTGISPAQGLTSAQFADEYASSLDAAGFSSDVYDVDAWGRKSPHHLGVLSHYDAVVWETGNDIVPRALGQVPGTAAKSALDVELAVRDYLNEGGKLIVTGKYAQFAQAANGLYWYNPFQPPECTTPGEYPCLPLLNDFQQYWLGAYVNISDGGTDPDGEPLPLVGTAGEFDGYSGDLNAAGSAQNQDHTAMLLATSSFLPADQFPQFASAAPLDWAIPGGPFDPHSGEWYVYSQQADVSYKRLSRIVDLTGAAAGELTFWVSHDTEADWDYLFVEAHEVGSEEWTTLPDANGHTRTDTGQSCPAGWVQQLHPFLSHYMNEACAPAGTTGTWNAATGTSAGWRQWSIDLSAYAGKQVEVSITYASDWASQGTGVFLDDVNVLVDGTPQHETGFEADLGGWEVSGSPAGSVANTNDWIRTQRGFDEGALTTTPDTVFAGFGFEGLAPAEREELIRLSMAHLSSGG